MTNKNLDILVVEDNPLHQKSTEKLTEQGHKVSLATNMMEGLKLLGFNPATKENVPVSYNAVLTDMMFPLGGVRGELVGIHEDEIQRKKEHPLGYALALYAARQGIPLIGIVTDMDHHAGPIAATFDLFQQETEDGRERVTFKINDSRLVLMDNRDSGGFYLLNDGTFTDKPWSPENKDKLTVVNGMYQVAKNWNNALNFLLKIGGSNE